MTDVLRGIDEDVPFDHGTCDALQSLCHSAATSITTQTASRAGAVANGARDFKGYFSGLFKDNASTARADAAELAQSLRDLAGFAGQLQAAAKTEQERREQARQWKQEMDGRNDFHKAWDDFWGSGEAPPVGRPDAPQDFSPAPPRAGLRTTPAPGSRGGGGGGTSSARPENLRAFASTSAGLDSELAGRPARLNAALADFAARCRWGTLDGSGVVAGFVKWLDANEEDVRWARTVAAAFAAAGGEGTVSTLSNSALLATLQAAGVSATRQDIVIDPAIAIGHPPTTGYSVDPVNTATGNFLEREVDLSFTPATSSLLWDRTYNSFTTDVGAFGPGWSSWAEARLTLTDEAARLTLPEGRVIVFPRLGDGWDRATGENVWLRRSDAGLRAAGNDGSWFLFDDSGRLRETSAGGDADTLRLEHEDGRLVRLTHVRGRSVELSWDDERVTRATASDGRAVDYTYDDRGRLVSATGPAGSRSYRWNDEDIISAVVDADGVVEADNVYDDHRRVTVQRTPHGRVVRFAYLAGNVTVVSDEDGGRSNTWIHDTRGRLIGVVDSDEQRQSTSYDGHGNPVVITERDGAVTVHEYDARGRRARTVAPGGSDISYGYDDQDRITTVVAASGGVVEYAYEGDSRNPVLLTDPEGGRTQLTWTAGLLTRLVDPTGVTVTFGYDEHGDLVSTTNALGHTALLERDAAGRVVASVTPSGLRTSYTYDRGGVLASRRDPDGAVWRFESTAAGRLVTVVDPTGGRTELERGVHGETVRTVDPLGRAVSRTLDDLGNLASVELPDGSAWRFTHDALSRLVATTDPSGGEWRTEHDANGEVTATIDPTGVRVGVSADHRPTGAVTVEDPAASASWAFDPLGRPTTRTEPDGSSAMTVYDLCGRPVELLDGEGGLTRLRRDAAGRVVEVTTPSGATIRYEHDECGRLAAVVDAGGARTSVERDSDGRVVREVAATGESTRTQHDPCGRVVARSVPGRGVARYRYDAAGRLVESSDTWYGHRKFRHDAAGQLVEVVNGNGGTTRFDHDAGGRVVAVTDPLGHTTRREFDAMGRCVAETDPLGRTVRAGYDAAGRQVWQDQPTGERLGWTYDTAGRLAEVAVDGRPLAAYARDLRERRVVVTDHTSPDRTVLHELRWNRRGQLVGHTRDGRVTRWSYDADGHRTGVTTPDGHTTSYGLDPVGRIAVVDHPLTGRAVLERDAAGRLVRATAGTLTQEWEHRAGFVVAHTVTDGEARSRTAVARDEDGRITGLDRDGVTTSYAYDLACQLVEARTGGSVTRWSYDGAGRLVAESVDGATRDHVHDAAGQLLATREADGRGARHDYDLAGRRTRTEHADGRVRELGWGATGNLASVTEHAGGAVRRTTLHVDALAQLSAIDGAEVVWDTAERYSPSLLQVGPVPVVGAGPVTGIGSSWTTPGWRDARSQGADPWAVGVTSGTGLPEGLGIGGAGELAFGGSDPLEWLQARVYDPTSRGFLSADPLDPVVGAGWAGNRYAYAGNDPLHALDPTGLLPATDADLQAYKDATNGWIQDNWEYVAGGVAMVAGVALIATGVGGPIGGMLFSAGLDTVVQKAQNGSVDWGKVAISGALGAWSGAGIVSKIPVTRVVTGRVATGVTRAALQGTVTGAGGGVVTGTYDYFRKPGPHTLGGAMGSAAREGLIGMGTGLVTGPTMYGADQLGQGLMPAFRANRLLRDEGDLVVLGGQVDTSVAARWDGHVSQLADDWHPNLNRAFVDETIARGRTVYSASNGAGDADLERLIDAGYDYRGDVWARTP